MKGNLGLKNSLLNDTKEQIIRNHEPDLREGY